MKRYSTTRRKIDKSGIRVLSTTYYPEISIENSDRFIMSKDGDRLPSATQKHYELPWVGDTQYSSDKLTTFLGRNYVN